MDNNKIAFRINGKEVSFEGNPLRPLLDYIREEMQLTAAKVGCGSGECGACTIIIDGKPVNSCLIPIASAADKDIYTVEGLRDKKDYQDLAEAMAENGGVQCGYCTPGIMAVLWAWKQDPSLFNGNVTAALKNNLCRCTGYQSIIKAAEKVVQEEAR